MFSETLSVSVTYDQKRTFFLRMLSIAEENDYRQRVFGISEAEKEEKEYRAQVDLLKELSVSMPVGLFPNKPVNMDASDETVYSESFKTPQAAIEQFFAEKTVLKERIAFYAVRTFFIRLSPEESFF